MHFFELHSPTAVIFHNVLEVEEEMLFQGRGWRSEKLYQLGKVGQESA